MTFDDTACYVETMNASESAIRLSRKLRHLADAPNTLSDEQSRLLRAVADGRREELQNAPQSTLRALWSALRRAGRPVLYLVR